MGHSCGVSWLREDPDVVSAALFRELLQLSHNELGRRLKAGRLLQWQLPKVMRQKGLRVGTATIGMRLRLPVADEVLVRHDEEIASSLRLAQRSLVRRKLGK
jgi:hypothetical protein